MHSEPVEPADADLPDDLADRLAEELLGVGEPQRSAMLEACVAAHPEHASSLRRLAGKLAAAEHLLDVSFVDTAATMPNEIGGHRVLRLLGEGAFGVVYLCTQQVPVVRPVAIKVLRPGAGDDQTLRRFAVERQLLATLNHAAVTQVYDAGVMPDGRPYFVMEYVEGQPLCRYCDVHDLSCEQRLRLFVEVCRGVAHAHSRRIVHRDLKPANVLVVDTESGPRPKIIDFGIAKALAANDTGDPKQTDAGRVIGTPGYMSPEQAAGRNTDIDGRADVFSLGVMLYEVLTGQLPWPRGAAATDTEPVRPSARVTASSKAAGPGSVNTRPLASQLRGDLDWVTLRALARERDRRYPTVGELAADIERHLRGEPVSAGPPTLRYRLRKFVRRNRTLVATAAGALLILAGAIVHGSSISAEASAARNSAAANFADAMDLVERLVARAKDPQLLELPAMDRARETLLQDAVSSYDRLLASHPTEPGLRRRRCEALLAISEVHWMLGETTRAGEVANAAADEASSLFQLDPGSIADRALLAEGLRKQGRALATAGDHAAARPLLAAARDHYAVCAAAAPEAHGRAYSEVLREAADTLDREHAEQELAENRQSLQVVDTLRRDHPGLTGLVEEHFEACTVVATQLTALHDYQQAKTLLDLAEADLPRIGADRARCTLRLRHQQGQCAWWLGDRPQAIRYLQSAVEAGETWLRDQPERLQPQEYLSRVLRDLGTFQNYVGSFEASNAAYRRAVTLAEAMVRRFPEDSSRLASLCRILRSFAQTLWDRYRIEDLDEAAACSAQATAVNDRIAATVNIDRQPRWLLLTIEAGIAESLGRDAGPLWQQIAADVPADAALRVGLDQQLLALTCIGLAHWHCVGNRDDAAKQWLDLARHAIANCKPRGDKMLVDVAWLDAQLAVRTGDHAAAAAAAARLLESRNTWFAHQRAGDCLFLAWRCAAAAEHPDQDLLQGYRERAIRNYDDAIDTLQGDAGEPLDPWYVLPWGWSSIRKAQLLSSVGDRSATELLQAALPKLAAVQSRAHRDQWDAAAFAEGRDLLRRSAPTGEHH